MVKIYIIIILLISTECLAQKRQFEVQRMNTDYKGTMSNGKSVLCFGNYGIITYTENFGNTWQGINIGDKYNIRTIYNVGSEYRGVTNYSLIKSVDNGKNWVHTKEFETEKIYDMCVYGSKEYVLTTDGVYTTDNNFVPEQKPILELNSNTSYSEIEVDGEYVYIICNGTSILRFQFDSQKLDTIEIRSLLYPTDPYATSLYNLKVDGSNVFVTMLRQFNSGNIHPDFLESTDKGKSWKRKTYGGNTYFFPSNDSLFMYSLDLDSSSRFLYNKYVVLDSTHYHIDSVYYTRINVHDTVERVMHGTSKSIPLYNHIHSVNSDTLIAVGNSNLISISFNRGKSWKILSFFNPVTNTSSIYFDQQYFSIMDKNRIHVISNNSVFTTNNGGITWLPQKYTSAMPTISTTPASYIFDNNGLGTVRFFASNANDTNVWKTTDFGETLQPSHLDTITIKRTDIRIKYIYQQRNACRAINAIFNSVRVNVKVGDFTRPSDYALIFLFDTNFRFVDSIRINATYMSNFIQAEDKRFYSLCLSDSGENIADSIGKTENYHYNYYLIHSTDGKKWDSIPIPLKQSLRYDGTKYYYMNRISTYITHHNDKLYFPEYRREILFIYDLKQGKLDSLILPAFCKDVPQSLEFGKELYMMSDKNTLYKTKGFGTTTVEWDSIAPEELMSQWDNYYPASTPNGRESTQSFRMFNDTTGFIVYAYDAPGGFSGGEYQLKVAKISGKSGLTDIVEPHIEDNSSQLWTTTVFPIPGNTTVNTYLYWDNTHNIDNADIKVYDIYGTQIHINPMKIHKTSSFRGILEWDCSNISSGIYIVQIKLSGASRSFPVLIAR